jgi:hypothetical protein
MLNLKNIVNFLAVIVTFRREIYRILPIFSSAFDTIYRAFDTIYRRKKTIFHFPIPYDTIYRISAIRYDTFRYIDPALVDMLEKDQ